MHVHTHKQKSKKDMKGGTQTQAKHIMEIDANVHIISVVLHNAAKVTAKTNTY